MPSSFAVLLRRGGHRPREHAGWRASTKRHSQCDPQTGLLPPAAAHRSAQPPSWQPLQAAAPRHSPTQNVLIATAAVVAVRQTAAATHQKREKLPEAQPVFSSGRERRTERGAQPSQHCSTSGAYRPCALSFSNHLHSVAVPRRVRRPQGALCGHREAWPTTTPRAGIFFVM